MALVEINIIKVVMEMFNKGKVIKYWGEVYVGIKMNWITPKEVINYCETGNILCNSDRFILLYLALDESLFKFLETIKQFIIEDKNTPITNNEDSSIFNIFDIPEEYWHFWEIEFLLRIINSSQNKEKKLFEVAAIHQDFNYRIAWHNFLYFMPSNDNVPIGIDRLYDNLILYVDNQLRLYDLN